MTATTVRRTSLAASSAVLLALAAAVAGPAAADQPTVSDVTTTSTSSVVYSMLTISGRWHVDNPTDGDALTVELGSGLVWPTGTTFPLTERTTGTTVATCTAAAGTTTLTCTFNEASEAWDTLDGEFTARAQITSQAIGTSTSTIVVAGASIPVAFAGTIVGQAADPTTYKGGWYAGDTADGRNRFDWYVNVSGSTGYRVSDPGATVQSVQCTDSDWSSAYAVKYAVNGDVAVFSAPAVSSVCRVKVTTVSADAATTNTATVNGTAYSARARASANGSGEGDGSNLPTPTPSTTPSPTTEAPAPEPSTEPTPQETTSAPEPTTKAPTPTPTPTPTTKEQSWPTPSSQPSASSQQSSPSPSSPSSTPTSVATTPTSTPSSQPSSPTPTTKRPLAHTGTDPIWFIAFAVVLIGAGAWIAVRSRRY